MMRPTVLLSCAACTAHSRSVDALRHDQPQMWQACITAQLQNTILKASTGANFSAGTESALTCMMCTACCTPGNAAVRGATYWVCSISCTISRAACGCACDHVGWS
jgi:hypothetical protein